jgi:hypothetical protein
MAVSCKYGEPAGSGATELVMIPKFLNFIINYIICSRVGSALTWSCYDSRVSCSAHRHLLQTRGRYSPLERAAVAQAV